MPVKNPLLRRYWIEFAVAPPPPVPPGSIPVDGEPYPWIFRRCGVTAFTPEDALWLLRQLVFTETPLPPVHQIIENVDLSTRDLRMWPSGVPIWPGVWFPIALEPLR